MEKNIIKMNLPKEVTENFKKIDLELNNQIKEQIFNYMVELDKKNLVLEIKDSTNNELLFTTNIFENDSIKYRVDSNRIDFKIPIITFRWDYNDESILFIKFFKAISELYSLRTSLNE